MTFVNFGWSRHLFLLSFPSCRVVDAGLGGGGPGGRREEGGGGGAAGGSDPPGPPPSYLPPTPPADIDIGFLFIY